ncbi:MAG: PLP-dependent transferase [Verrucomicrobiales bacterium]
MRELLLDPACRPEDLGQPLPDSPHACSVAMPLWRHVVGYEEGDPAVTDAFRAGYPRFFLNPITARLHDALAGELAGEGEACLAFPSDAAAARCAAFAGPGARAAKSERGVWAAIFPESARKRAFAAWRYLGEGVSSRRSEAALGGPPEPAGSGDARRAIKARVAEHAGRQAGEVFLFPSGMAAIAALHRAACAAMPGRATAQFDFPYVDALRVQREFGAAQFYPVGDAAALADLERRLGAGEIGAVFTEAPSNPMMRTPDAARLASACRAAGIPLFIDDTIGTSANIEALRFADAATTSLTKYFNGEGDVMAGAVTLRRDSPAADLLRQTLAAAETDAPLWGGDAVALERHSRDYAARVRRINATASEVHAFLAGHPKVAAALYPSDTSRAEFDALRRPGGGFGGLISIVLRDPADAPPFYDRLRISKGPSLGTNFSLACPYTILAHYDELEYVTAQCGVPGHLVRLGIGLEEPGDLIGRLGEALG